MSRLGVFTLIAAALTAPVQTMLGTRRAWSRTFTVSQPKPVTKWRRTWRGALSREARQRFPNRVATRAYLNQKVAA